MGSKNKGGREVRKPKQDKTKKPKGQSATPSASSLDAINRSGGPGRG